MLEVMTTTMMMRTMTSKNLHVWLTSSLSSLKLPDFQTSPSHFFKFQLDMCSPEYLHVCFIFIVIVSSSSLLAQNCWLVYITRKTETHNRKSLAAPYFPQFFPILKLLLKQVFHSALNRSEHHPFPFRVNSHQHPFLFSSSLISLKGVNYDHRVRSF